MIWFIEGHSPNKLFLVAWWKQLLTVSGIILTSLFGVSIGYLLDWGVYGLPIDTELGHLAEDDSLSDKED